MKPLNKILALALTTGVALSSCKKDDNGPANPNENQSKTRYIIAATPTASTGVADYLLTSDGLMEGSISTVGNGQEQDGTWRYYISHKNKFFSLLYGQGNPGAVTTYNVNGSGELTKISDFQSETVHVFNKVNDDLLLIKIPRSGATQDAMFIRIDANQALKVGEKLVNIVDLAGNGERAHFTWATQVGNKVFAPYMSIRGITGNVFGTAYPDSSWVAVFSYPDLTLEKIIRDNRTGSIGAYYVNGLAVTENGDVYGFSPASGTDAGALTSTKPSAFVRIKSGETEFDQSWFYDVQAASGGHHMFRQDYVGNGKFLVQMYGIPNSIATTGNCKLAVVDVINKSFTWVTGAPADIAQSGISRNNLPAGDSKSIYIGVNSKADGAYVYSVDVTNATATRGMKIEGGTITAIEKLTY